MSRYRLALVAVCGLVVVGCAARTTFDWGDYDPSLYAYYKDPTKLASLEDSLQSVISSAEEHHSRVPPGIYAEYGYLRLQEGQSDKAVALFTEEETHWPESKAFMDRMIQVAAKPAAPASAAAPSGQ